MRSHCAEVPSWPVCQACGTLHNIGFIAEGGSSALFDRTAGWRMRASRSTAPQPHGPALRGRTPSPSSFQSERGRAYPSAANLGIMPSAGSLIVPLEHGDHLGRLAFFARSFGLWIRPWAASSTGWPWWPTRLSSAQRRGTVRQRWLWVQPLRWRVRLLGRQLARYPR